MQDNLVHGNVADVLRVQLIKHGPKPRNVLREDHVIVQDRLYKKSTIKFKRQRFLTLVSSDMTV